MTESCETCQYIDIDAEQEPCSVCMHNYMDMYEKENFKNLVEPLRRLTNKQIGYGNANADYISCLVLNWIDRENHDTP